MKKLPITGGKLRVKVWPILTEAIETGATFGLRRAFKHPDSQMTIAEFLENHEADAIDTLENEILNALCNVLDIVDEEPL